jgi:hypothetical protein
MDYRRREEIFSKDIITVEELSEVLGMNYQMAAKTMRKIKSYSDRLKIQGKVHTEDYMDYFNIKPSARYYTDIAGDFDLERAKIDIFRERRKENEFI